MSSTPSEKNSDEIFALVDCNNFYASCERIFRPELEKKPIVILSNNDGCIVSRSNEAKALGIPMAAAFFEWKEFIEKNGIHVFSSNYALYGDMSQRVMDTLTQFTPKLEIYSIDEAFLSLSGFDRLDLTEYVCKIAQTVKKWTGIPVSVGLAKTKTLAKIASRFGKRKPEYAGVCNIVNHPDVDSFLKVTDVGKIWGIGRQNRELLNKYDIYTALDLKNADDSFIRKHLTVVGLRTVWELRGEPCIELEEINFLKKAIACTRSFGKPIETYAAMSESIAFHMSRAAEKLRRQKSIARSIHIFIMTSRFKEREERYNNSSTISLPVPTADSITLLHCAHGMLRKIFKPGYKYKKAGVILTDILPEDQIQFDIFDSEYPGSQKQKLMKTLDGINLQWGRNTIHSASTGINRLWKMKQARLSPRYTTRWEELPIVHS